jgi:hypothetical protein
MNPPIRFLSFVIAETVAMGLFFWLCAAVESLWRREVGDLFAVSFSLIVMGAAMTLPFIFVGALICTFVSAWLRPIYFRFFCLFIGFFCLFPFVFTKGLDSLLLIPASLGLVSWLLFSSLLRVRDESHAPIT